MILPATREQVRISILRYANQAGSRGMSASLLAQFVRTEFRKNFTEEDLTAEFSYLQEKQLLAPVGKRLSPELTVWKITAEGRDFLATEGIE